MMREAQEELEAADTWIFDPNAQMTDGDMQGIESMKKIGGSEGVIVTLKAARGGGTKPIGVYHG